MPDEIVQRLARVIHDADKSAGTYEEIASAVLSALITERLRPVDDDMIIAVKGLTVTITCGSRATKNALLDALSA